MVALQLSNAANSWKVSGEVITYWTIVAYDRLEQSSA
jgi:hypothetical protein